MVDELQAWVERLRRESQPCEIEALDERSRRIADRLIELRPEIVESFRMVEGSSAGRELLALLESPTGEPSRHAVLWMERGEPSLGFGDWHTHADVWVVQSSTSDLDEAIAELVCKILSDVFVLTEERGGEHDGLRSVLDLGEPESVARQLTAPHSSGAMRVESWGGSADREWSLDDLEE